jgi:beta-phosphoglucomutase
MVKTIIFDLDGVLVYTDKFHYLAWKKMADRIGVPFDETINNRLRGVSRMDSLEIILERSTRKYTTEEKENLAEEKNGYYKEFLKNMSPADVRPEIRGMLKELHERGYHLALPAKIRNSFWRRHNLRMILTLSPMAQILRNPSRIRKCF